jgi:hypothetical protein
MTSPLLIDTSSNCNILQKFLVDDLLPYNIAADGDSLTYSDSGSSATINYNLSPLSTLIDESYNQNDTWYPLIINNDTHILYKELSDDGAYQNNNSDLPSGRIGIENFITFSPQFNSFDASSGSMNIDWILNRSNSSLGVYYGIMCWMRYSTASFNQMIIGGATGTLESFPNGARLQHSSSTDNIYIKINDNQLYLVNQERYKFSSTGAITHNNENNFIIQASSLIGDTFKLSDLVNEENKNTFRSTSTRLNSISLNNQSVSLWVPDGDFLSYFISTQEKLKCFTQSIPSQSFVSPCLHSKYNAIYRIITLDEPRKFESRSLLRSRCYRKIAQALSTSPFVDDFSINALDNQNIKIRIESYIASCNFMNVSLEDEITLLRSTLVDISQILQKTIVANNGASNDSLYLDTKTSPYSINNNLIRSKKDLFTKLLSKYGANLVLTSDGQLTAKNNLITDNAGIVITQNAAYYCDKNTTDTEIFNNQTITYDNLKIETNITSNSTSTIDIKNNVSNNTLLSIPLYDIAKGSLDSTKAYFCPRLIYAGNVPGQFMDSGSLYNPAYDPNNIADIFSSIYAVATNTIRFEKTGGLQPSSAIFGGSSGPELDALNLFVDRRDTDNLLPPSWHEQYFDNQNQYYWTVVSEPLPQSCEFMELTGGGAGSLLSGERAVVDTATSRYVKLKVKYSGKYIINCQLISPYGTISQQKTIYIVDGADKIREQNTFGNIIYQPNNPFKNLYFNHETQTYEQVPTTQSSTENVITFLNRDKLRVTNSRVTKLAISNIGQVVVPIDTSFTVKELIGTSAGGGGGIIPEFTISKLDDLYKFQWVGGYQSKTSAPLIINYRLNNTIVKIRSIYLEKIRSSVPGCEQCYSLYEPKLRSYKSTTFTGSGRVSTNRLARINKFPESFDLYEHKIPQGGSKAEQIRSMVFIYPTIHTTNSPKVKTFGGYSRSFVNTLGISNTPNAPDSNITALGVKLPSIGSQDTPLSASAPDVLPVVSGFPMDYTSVDNPGKHLLCYQKAIPYNGGSTISFHKGVMHPNSGWLPHTSSEYAIHANRSSILKFNPAARKTFSFVGPKIEPLTNKNSDIDLRKINQNIFSSTVTLQMAQEIQWDPACYCKDSPEGYDSELYNKNQTNKEYIDISTNISDHGYRYLYGGSPKRVETTASRGQPTANDEFDANQTANAFTYSFAVTGPASLPENVLLPDGKKQIRIPAINSFTIQDIEVKLNFLNYVNTKNLVIWLESDISTASIDDTGRAFSNINAGTNFIDQSIPVTMGYDRKYSPSNGSNLYSLIPNSGVASYLDNLLNTLPDELPTENRNESGDLQVEQKPLRALLLNQEYIQNKNYNFSIKFSDRAPKNNVLYDHNLKNNVPVDTITNSGINIPLNKNLFVNSQNIINNNEEIVPTLCANNYSDREACYYSSILKHNKLNITSRSLNKFQNHTIFTSSAQPGSACEGLAPKQKGSTFNGQRSFTLKIMIVDEQDEMGPNDMLVCNEYLTNIESAEKKQTGISLFNSLCSWELILHVGPVAKPVPHTNPNLSSYGNCDVLSLMNYDGDPQYPGYGFIADMSNHKHLLPLANLDAPNSSIYDTSVCLGSKNDPIGGGFVVKPIPFPTDAIINIMASLFEGTTGTLLGTATIPGAGFDAGFNAIIGWLSETKFIDTLEDSGRQIYAPSFNKYPFGSPEKILLNLKKPGSLWYSLEAVIMKYWNTPILKQTKYNYIKAQRGTGKYISEFSFSNISDYTELLDTKNIPDITTSCDQINSPVTFPMILDNHVISSGDLINISITGTPTCSGGLYVAFTGFTRISNDTANLTELSKATSLLLSNVTLPNNIFNSDLQTNINNNKVISIPSRIPYDIFSAQDTVECYDKSDRLLTNTTNSSISNFTIVNKGLVFKNNQLHTIFVLNNPITSQDTLSPTPDSNVLFVYKSQSTINNDKYQAYNTWGLDENKSVTNSVPHANFSAHSIGSYGNVSPFVDKNLLDANFRYNKLQNIYEILNNSQNDRINYNSVKLYTENSSPITGFNNSKVYGFNYSISDLHDNIYYSNKNNVTIESENIRQVDGDFFDTSASLLKQIDKSAASNEKSRSFMYVVMPGGLGIGTNVSGLMTIENDFYEYMPVEFLSESDISKLSNRLQTIENTAINDSLENIAGDPTQTASIISSHNIKYMLKHYDKLKEDPAACHSGSSDKGTCYKLRTRDALNKIYTEQSNIIKLLNEQCTSIATITYASTGGDDSFAGTITSESEKSITAYDTSNQISKTIDRKDIVNINKTYTRKCDLNTDNINYISSGILPKIKPVLTVTNNAIDIHYTPVNTDHYWINIDPKQSCIYDFASNPKVLLETRYKCVRANEVLATQFTTRAANSNVCPDFASQEQIPNMGSELFTIENDVFVYRTLTSVINNQKAAFEAEYGEAIIGWREYTRERFFNINEDPGVSTGTSDGGTEGAEITVMAQEKYLIPIIPSRQVGFVSENTNTDYSADTNVAPGESPCAGGTNDGSPAGLGLLTSLGDRAGWSTRVENIFNLASVNEIQVRIKRIPRMLRGCDLLSTVYRYGNRNLYRPINNITPKIPFEVDVIGINGAINNSLYCWQCLKANKNNSALEYSELPPFFKLQNEMIFRSFFGSVDRIENRQDLMVSYFPWELIPYEY